MTHGPSYGRQDAAREAAFLHQRLSAASVRLRGESEISDRLKLISIGALIVLALYLALTQLSPWSLSYTLRHLVAAGGCDAARMVKLAPAYRGEPGYWPWLDEKDNGIACSERKVSAT